jgi:osmoprotectant transport system permease protein
VAKTFTAARNRPNSVIPLLSLMALIMIVGLDFTNYQANRIVPSLGLSFFDATGLPWTLLYSAGLGGLLILGLNANSKAQFGIVVLATLLLCALPWTLHTVAIGHLPSNQPFARIGLSAGFWSLVFVLSLVLIDCFSRIQAKTWLRSLVLIVIIGSLSVAVWLGRLDDLALLREYSIRSSQFATALSAHLLLAGGAVAISLILGFLLAIQILMRPRWQQPVLGVLSFFQTIPSLALFGLLIAPMSILSAQWPWLQQFGIRGIGWAPALLALIGYSLLPMVRNTWVALSEVPVGVLDAARGMGMSRGQRFFRVRLPLALPVILEGIRITSIQAIGLTAVAALIGAGGFGTFIFQGLGQAATELILLGAIPTIALALLADGLLTSLAAFTRRQQGMNP